MRKIIVGIIIFIFLVALGLTFNSFGKFLLATGLLSATGAFVAFVIWKMATIKNNPPRENKTGQEEKTTKADKKSDGSLSKAVWIILIVFVGMPVLGLLIMIGGWLYGVSHQRQEKVWVATLAVMPGHKEQYDVRNFSSRTCEVVDTPATFQMSCSNKYGKDIYIFKWDDKSTPEGKWWRENRENNVGGTFRIQKVSPTLYLGVEKTRSGKEASFQVSLQNK